MKGQGHDRYAGAGILGRYDFDSRVYAEGSLRAGRNRNTFDTNDIKNLTTGETARYHLNSSYLGGHAGAGYVLPLSEKDSVDMSAKYLWLNLKGKDVTVAGDRIHFDDINSHRLRLGGEYRHQYSEQVVLRAGAGYEYEFDGKAGASVYGYGIPGASVKGGTGLLSVGTTITPAESLPLSVDINLTGYTGQRDGAGGNIRFSYSF